jgi:hypothetical protein
MYSETKFGGKGKGKYILKSFLVTDNQSWALPVKGLIIDNR